MQPISTINLSLHMIFEFLNKKSNCVFVRLLLEREEIAINAVDKNGRTPLMYAAMHGYAAIAEHLLDHPGIEIDLQGSILI